MAVSAATALVGLALEEQQFVSQPAAEQRLWLEGAMMGERGKRNLAGVT
jgi:hypothetical protein